MNEFLCVIAATITIFLGCFAFMYYLMNMFEKRLETKIDYLAEKIDVVMAEQADAKKRTDQLYQILINLVTNNLPRTHP